MDFVVAGTVMLLTIAIAICILAIYKNRPGGPTMSNSLVGIGAGMLIACVIVICGLFIAYFNGIFNRYKTTQDRMALKYDYMMHYPSVKLLPSLTPGVNNTNAKSSMDKLMELLPLLKPLAIDAVKAITKDTNTKARVERALSNVALRNDTLILAEYDFSLPIIKLTSYMQDNEQVIKSNQEEVTQLIINVIAELQIDKKQFIYSVDIPGGNRQNIVSSKMDILGVLNTYSYFIIAYPKLAQTCVNRNGCPFSLMRDTTMSPALKR